MGGIEQQLRTYYEAESAGGLRPAQGERRRALCAQFARRLEREGRRLVVDVGAGPATDHGAFDDCGVAHIGVDLAIGNAIAASRLGRTVVPASLFDLPFPDAAFPSGWSMSTFQHVPDAQIDDALAEFVRVLIPGAPVVIGLWGGRDEIIESETSTSGLRLPRHFTLRRHDRIRAILTRHLVVESDEAFRAGPADWEYHVSHARTPAVRPPGRPVEPGGHPARERPDHDRNH